MSEWTRPPVERQTKFATSVLGLDEAFAFIMSKLGEVDDVLNIQIKPIWTSADDFATKRFEVAISGMVELPAYAPESLS